MAVYTKITKDLLISFIKNYDLGEIKDFQGIREGVENTNYKIISSKNIYILTIFEKRVNEDDLPFFINLLNHLSIKKIKCPRPIADNIGDYINRIFLDELYNFKLSTDLPLQFCVIGFYFSLFGD